MNASVKALWVAALRSGEYAQTRRRLRDTDGFCCWGVLCDLAVKAGVDVAVRAAHHDPGITAYDGSVGLPPDSVARWADLLTSRYGLIENVVIDGEPTPLAELNDSGHEFAEIADLIEAQL